MPGWQFPWDSEPAVADPSTLTALLPTPAKPRGRRPASARAMGGGSDVVPAWRNHHLTISGPADGVDRFAAAACGSGVIPWRLDGVPSRKIFPPGGLPAGRLAVADSGRLPHPGTAVPRPGRGASRPRRRSDRTQRGGLQFNQTAAVGPLPLRGWRLAGRASKYSASP